jgi:3-methylcrotonyl-CoA carboxylase alpha subunit
LLFSRGFNQQGDQALFNSVLIANRGEIACRILRTARRLGIRTVAVYSDADRLAQHVVAADEAIRIGAAAPRDSYLNIDHILEAARTSGAQAIHPGYGFLSESAAFARACSDAGFIFVGPDAATIAAVGSKIHAKARMREAGVPVLPGYEGVTQDFERLEAEARGMGFPIMVKPAAGGGGKGMRVLHNQSELRAALPAVRRLAENNFGDGALLLERFLAAPRHVEVQIFGDRHGGLVHLGDRDCSMQRRQQKLIEEAPAPGLPHRVRGSLHAAALRVAQELRYVNAGTVEFLLNGDEFYFMEMNTRLQVEHPVTEEVTGLDLVEWQFRVAAGEPLPLRQEQISFRGHAIEARICAEDPATSFMPSPGELRLLQWPQRPSVRVDAGFVSGDTVPAQYDSLLGKVVAFGHDRHSAIEQLAMALEHTLCVGVASNERFLVRALRSLEFREHRHHVALLQQQARHWAREAAAGDQIMILAALALARRSLASPAAADLPLTLNCPLFLNDEPHQVQLRLQGGVPGSAMVDGRSPFWLSELAVEGQDIGVMIDGSCYRAMFHIEQPAVHLWTAGCYFELKRQAPESSNKPVV